MVTLKEPLEQLIQNVEQRTQKRVRPLRNEENSSVNEAQAHPARYKNFVELVRFLRNPGYNPTKAIQATKRIKLLNNLEEYIARAEEGQDCTLIPRQLETFRKIHHFLE